MFKIKSKKKKKKIKSNVEFYNKFISDLFGERKELFDVTVDITFDFKDINTFDLHKLILERHREKYRYPNLTGGINNPKRFYYWCAIETYDVIDIFNHFHHDFSIISTSKWKDPEKATILFEMIDFQINPDKWLVEAVREMKIRHEEIDKIWKKV